VALVTSRNRELGDISLLDTSAPPLGTEGASGTPVQQALQRMGVPSGALSVPVERLASEGWRPAAQLGEYRLERLLGKGAMGEVWLAHDTVLERAVAIKFATLEGRAPSAEDRTRFRLEARAIARLRHPNIIAIHHAGESNGCSYLVTELLSGESLERVKLPLDLGRALGIGVGLARGLVAAHRAGVVHRDIKPANAFLCTDGAVKLLDFGLAKFTVDEAELLSTFARHGAMPAPGEPAAAADSPGAGPGSRSAEGGLVGTPLYMPPELWRSEPATRRSDVYSLGALLYELIAGSPPFAAPSLLSLWRRVHHDEAPSLRGTIPDTLAELIERCLNKEPEPRPTAEEVQSILEAIELGHQSLKAGAGMVTDPESNPYRGLEVFLPEHRSVFFGRQTEIRTVLAELRVSPLVVVTAPSGAGKSSLVRAGVTPQIEAGALGPGTWEVVTMTPGLRPLDALATALIEAGAGNGSSLQEVLDPAPTSEAGLLELLDQDPAWLAQCFRRSSSRLMLVIDQLEELVTLAGEMRNAFLTLLRELVSSAPAVRVLCTLRSDFLGRLADLGDLRHEILRSVVALGPLSEAGLRQAIEEPARSRGHRFESAALVDSLVHGHGDGTLPLLEFALATLWEARDRQQRVLTATALEQLGGFSGALATHADRVLATMSPAVEAEARRLLLDMVTADGTRGQRGENELLEAAETDIGPEGHLEHRRKALRLLVEGRLVVASEGEHGASYQITHDALLQGWPALREWLSAEQAVREVEARLDRAATEWERLGSGREGLWRGRQLDQLELLKRRPRSRRQRAFVQACHDTLRRDRWRRQGWRFGIPGGLLLCVVSILLVRAAARRTEIDGLLQRTSALVGEAASLEHRQLAARASALASFERGDPRSAEAEWARAQKTAGMVENLRIEALDLLQRVLAYQPLDRRARNQTADLLVARIQAAERLHRRDLLQELRSRLQRYDHGPRQRALDQPATITFEIAAGPTRAKLWRYISDGVGRLTEQEPREVGPGVGELPAGSYLLVADCSPQHQVVRFPFLLSGGERRTLRVACPRKEEVPEGYAYIPAGRFLYGSADEEAVRSLFDAQPEHEVEVGPFLMARTEVTFGQYAAFLASLPKEQRQARSGGRLAIGDGGQARLLMTGGTALAETERHCPTPARPCQAWPRLPFDAASYDDAKAYVAWLDRTGKLPGARLCRDKEWERAARGADRRRYPHGNSLRAGDACALASFSGDRSRASACEVGNHPATRSPFGIDDLVGNVWEWIEDPPSRDQPQLGITRGSAWEADDLSLSSINRAVTPKLRRWLRGIRVCAPAPRSVR
jgi:serine/threonine protein kinase/formylglycine-generating enzyme required for sulfatase activity